MSQRKEYVCTSRLVLSAALVTGLALAGGFSKHGRAARHQDEMMLHGTPVESEKVSGYRGTRRELGVDDNEQAV